MEVTCARLLFLLAFGAYCYVLFKVGRNLYTARKSKEWPVVTGTITASSVDTEKVSSGKGRFQTVYFPRIRYRYLVDGHEYWGDKVSYIRSSSKSSGAWESSQEAAQAICNRYQPASSHDLYYNPKNPADSVLQPGLQPGSLNFSLPVIVVMVVVGLFILILGVGLWAYGG